MRYEFIVQEPDSQKRLDLFLMEQGIPYSRSQLKKWIESERVSVNAKPGRGSYRLKTGDILELIPLDPIPLKLTPEAIPLSIIFEDNDLLVLDKSAGLVVHPAPGNYSGTLVQALLFHCEDLSGIGGVLRPGIVHRLDKDTSGLMVVAKNDHSHQQLINQFQTGKVIKEYQALVWGSPPQTQGRIDKPIGRHPVHRKKMALDEVHGKPAITEWRVLERYPIGISLLNLGLKTGRTHQIRVHLSSQGWPVVGDPVYGGRGKLGIKTGSLLVESLRSISRQLLHSCRLAFSHPVKGNPLDFRSDLPRDMETLIKYLKTVEDHSSLVKNNR